MDPIRFEQDIRVTLQDLGWRRGGRYLPPPGRLYERGILVSDPAGGEIPATAFA